MDQRLGLLAALALRSALLAAFWDSGHLRWGAAYHSKPFRDLLWSKWLFTPGHLDVNRDYEVLSWLGTPDRFSESAATMALHELQSSPLSLNLSQFFVQSLSTVLHVDRLLIWFALNCIVDAGIAVCLCQVATNLQAVTLNALDQLRLKIWCRDLPNTTDQEEPLPKTLVPSALLPALFWLLHPLSIYKCVVVPDATCLPLLLMVETLREVLKDRKDIRLSKIVVLLGLYSAFNFSTIVLGLALPIAAVLSGTTSVVSHVGTPLNSSEIRNIARKGALIIVGVLISALVAQALSLLSLGLADFSTIANVLGLLWKRHLNFESSRPDSGALWYLVIIMFQQARFIFFTFFNYHFIVHSIPLTLRFARYLHYLLLFLFGIMPLFERQVALPSIVFSLALLLVISPIVGNIRALFGAMIVQNVGFALQMFTFDIWIKKDASNANLAFMTTIIPFTMTAIFWLHSLTCVVRLHNVDQLTKDEREQNTTSSFVREKSD